jgi:hypothetical protein
VAEGRMRGAALVKVCWHAKHVQASKQWHGFRDQEMIVRIRAKNMILDVCSAESKRMPQCVSHQASIAGSEPYGHETADGSHERIRGCRCLLD